MQTWNSFEDRVRTIASLRWRATCKPEHLHGVDFDGVIRVSADELVIIEITTNATLGKVREDTNKIVPLRLKMIADGVLCRGYIVLDEAPTNSMKEFGEQSHIKVYSLQEFETEFFDFVKYRTLRASLPFGSAVDSKTGQNDNRSFVPVGYRLDGSDALLSIRNLADKLLRRQKIVLTGDYGTGKSRCVREIFSDISERVTAAGAYPIAINLRDHWSSSNALEIIAGHLGNIGLQGSVDNLISLLNAGALILLLDGFDEIGTQVYDPAGRDRKSLRRHAVRGLRDLIVRSRAGILLTGRSHFFDSDKEMLEALGIANGANVFIGRVPEHFTEDEAKKYLSGLGVTKQIPKWLPRKPLVFQLLAEIESSDVDELLAEDNGEFEFWGAFFYAICLRESRGISESVSAETVSEILLELAVRSRYSKEFLGRLSPREIDQAYEEIVGSTPDEAGRLLLARLCTLGRIEPESPDRQFIDHGFVDVLRATGLVDEVSSMSDRLTKKKWLQGLRLEGVIYAARTVEMYELQNSCFAYLRKFGSSGNSWLIGEVVSILSIVGNGRVDFQGLQLSEGYVPFLSFHKKALTNLKITNSEILTLDIDQTTVTGSHNVSIEGCIVGSAFGVSGPVGLPHWVVQTEVMDFDAISTAASIKQSDILGANKLLLALVHKIFFQRGAGREESSLQKGGYGQDYSAKLIGKILNLLLREGVVEKIKGDEGWIYKPVRAATARMNKMRSELSLSNDAIWKTVLSFRE